MLVLIHRFRRVPAPAGKCANQQAFSGTVFVAAFYLFMVALLIPDFAQATETQQIKKSMPIRVTLNVTWKVRSGETLNRGAMNLIISGTAKLDQNWSMMDDSAPPGSFVTYSAEGITCHYTYREKISQDHPPKGCEPVLAEYHGGGSFNLEKINTAMSSGLNIRKLGSLIPREMLAFAPPEAKDVMVDYYDFIAVAKKQRVHGRKRGYNECNYISDTKEINPARIVIRYRIADDGSMTGKRRWRARGNSGAPPLQVRISNLPGTMERKPLKPAPERNGDVTYAVKWTFGELKPVVRIERHEGNYWIPLSPDEPMEVTVGEKMELRGIVLPEEKDPKKGRWVIKGDRDSGRRKMFIKKYDASANRGRVLYLDPDKDLTKSEVNFYWVDCGNGTARYKTMTDGKQLEEAIKFRVKKPKFVFRVEADPHNTYGPMTLALSSSEKFPEQKTDCCGKGSRCNRNQLQEELEKKKREQEARKKESRSKQDKLDDPNSGLNQEEKAALNKAIIDLSNKIKENQAEIERLEEEIKNCNPIGVQYLIKFFAEPQDNIHGKVQFVQLATQEGIGLSLDGCYPYPKNIPNNEYATLDMPGFATSFATAGGKSYKKFCFDFNMYLMFRPDGEGNEWVPLKKADWPWCGAIRCSNGECAEDTTAAVIPKSGVAPDCGVYPEWNKCYRPK
jgi:hypothetical protein